MKHALITGAAKRVGREIALHLAANGYDITIHYNDSYDEACQTKHDVELHNVKCWLVQADLSDLHQAGEIVQKAYAQGGEITLLINNASLFLKDDLANVTAQSLQSHMNINCFSAVMLTQELLKQKMEAHSSSLNNLSPTQVICLLDGMNSWSISPNFLAYSLSKQALEQFIKLQAASLAPHIRLNGIALGATMCGHMDKEDTFAKIAELSPLKRVSNPQEVCDAVMFLENIPTITGQIISLSSGFNLQSISGARF